MNLCMLVVVFDNDIPYTSSMDQTSHPAALGTHVHAHTKLHACMLDAILKVHDNVATPLCPYVQYQVSNT